MHASGQKVWNGMHPVHTNVLNKGLCFVRLKQCNDTGQLKLNGSIKAYVYMWKQNQALTIATLYQIFITLLVTTLMKPSAFLNFSEILIEIQTFSVKKMHFKISSANSGHFLQGIWVDTFECTYPDSKFHGANMGPIWGWQDPGGPHVGPMNFAIWVGLGATASCAQHLHYVAR